MDKELLDIIKNNPGLRFKIEFMPLMEKFQVTIKLENLTTVVTMTEINDIYLTECLKKTLIRLQKFKEIPEST